MIPGTNSLGWGGFAFPAIGAVTTTIAAYVSAFVSQIIYIGTKSLFL